MDILSPFSIFVPFDVGGAGSPTSAAPAVRSSSSLRIAMADIGAADEIIAAIAAGGAITAISPRTIRSLRFAMADLNAADEIILSIVSATEPSPRALAVFGGIQD